VTLGVFPAISGMVTSTAPSPAWRGLFPAVLFVVFNLGDMAARLAPPSCHLVRGRSTLALALSRIALIPLFMVCHMRPGDSAVPTLLPSDAAPLLLLALLAASNGFLTACPLIYGPLSVPPPEQKQAASLLVLALNVGLTLGSLLSFLLHGLVCSCNPFVN